MASEIVFKYLPYALALLWIASALLASGHALLYKRDSRAAVSWLGLLLLAPLFGVLLYILIGINRIKRKAGKLRRRRLALEILKPASVCSDEELVAVLTPAGAHLAPVARVARVLTGRELLEGNAVTPLVNGEQAYPSMLAAIDASMKSVALLAYIFELDSAGEQFVAALARAQKRGISVRVLIEFSDGRSTWNVVGASENVIEASWQAIVDGVEYKLYKSRKSPSSPKSSRRKKTARV